MPTTVGSRFSDQLIGVKVPDSATSGELLVTIAGIPSNAVRFPVLRTLDLGFAEWFLAVGSGLDIGIQALDTDGRAVADASYSVVVEGDAIALSVLRASAAKVGTARLTVMSGNLASTASISVVTSGPVVNTIAGSGAPGLADGWGHRARFNEPLGLAAAPDGALIVADFGNSVLRRIDATGHVTTWAGSTPGLADGSASVAKFGGPFGLSFTPSGTLLVADFTNHAVRLVSPSGNVSTLKGNTGVEGGLPDLATFREPISACLTPDGKIHVTDKEKLWTLDAGSGAASPSVDGAGLLGGLACDPSGPIYLTDYARNEVLRFPPSAGIALIAGGKTGSADGDGAGASFNTPIGLALAPGGILYIADQSNHRIRRVTFADGRVSTLAGSGPGDTSGQALAARFRKPTGLALGQDGRLYVTEQDGHRIRVIDGL